MQSQHKICNDQELVTMLNSDAPADQFSQLLQHVECCSHCQSRLDDLAADPQHWNQATQLLSGFSSHEPFRESTQSTLNHDGPLNPQQVAWTETMAKQLLSPASHPEMLGRIGRYEVERLIGSGGMGIVFKAIDTELNRPVAIKILAPYLAGNGAARQRFAREAKAAAAVVHEHVVPIHNVETDGHSPFLVMRFVAGESLQARLDREGSQDNCQVLRIGMQVAAGLSAAHSHGLVHRDIKPSNILVESGVDRSLITDFGLARAADDASLTNTGYHPGTPQYMSPEQARGDAMDHRSDLFSLGSVMYTMCTGRAPFRAETSYGVLRRITDTQPRDIREINPLVPSWLCAIINKLMSKDAGDRFQSAEHLQQLLSSCLSHLQRPGDNPLPPEVLELEKQGTQRKYYLPTIVNWQTLMLGIACVALLIKFWPASSPNDLTLSALKTDDPTISAALDEGAPTEGGKPKAESKKRTRPPGNNSPASNRRNRPPTPPAEKVRALLNEATTVNLQAVTLKDAVQEILSSAKIGARLNTTSLQDESIDLNHRFSIATQGTVSSILQRLCKLSGVAYIVHDTDIEIVSPSYASSHPVLRYYDLSEVMPSNRYVASVTNAVRQLSPDEFANGHFTASVVDSWMIVGASERVHLDIERMLSQLVFPKPFSEK